MKIAIFCFSGTGNTYFVAKTIQKILQETHSCNLFAIEKHLQDADAIIQTYDLIGLGYPTHGSSLPFLVFQFIESLSIHQKEAFTFCTQWLFSGDGAAYGARQLAKKGFRVLWQEHFRMPNNITDLRLLDHKKTYDYSKIHARVAKKADRFVADILEHRKHKKGSNVFSLCLGLMQRVPFEHMNKKVLQNAISIQDELCVKCGICVDLCPTKNLVLVQDKMQTRGQCTLCYRCVNHCPKQAIHLITKQQVLYPYLGPSATFSIDDVAIDDKIENK